MKSTTILLILAVAKSCAGEIQSFTTTSCSIPTVTATATLLICPQSTQSACGNTCYNLKTSIENCGACGNKCPTGQICTNGFCGDDPSIYKCNNPQACSPDSQCGNSCGFCKPDSTGQGYCVQQGVCTPANTCNTNADCASSICLDTCCGKTCDNAADNFCIAPHPRRLFRRQEGGQIDFSRKSLD